MSNPLPSAKVADPVSAAFEAFKSGSDVESAVYGTPSAPAPKPTPAPGASLETQSETQEEPADEAQSATSEEATAAEEPTPSEAAAEEELVVTDESGARRRLKVSYTDRAKIKRAYEQAAGVRKALAEREQLKQKYSSIEAEHKDLKSSWTALEEAFGKQGIAGVVNLLGGKPDAFEAFMRAEVEKRNRYATASPEERAQMDLQSQLEQERAEKKALMDKVQADLTRSEEAKKAAEQKQAESVLYPTFEKYRFAGKMGDSTIEEQLDAAIWEQARQKLMALPDDEITPAAVDKAFRETSSTFRKAIDKQSQTKLTQTVTKRKQAAQEAAAAAVQGGQRAKASSQEAVAGYMKTSDFGGLFRDVFSGKIKL